MSRLGRKGSGGQAGECDQPAPRVRDAPATRRPGRRNRVCDKGESDLESLAVSSRMVAGGKTIMAEQTGISWTDATFNPWWGCWPVSPGCALCYADREASRHGYSDLWQKQGPRRTFGEKHWNEPRPGEESPASAPGLVPLCPGPVSGRGRPVPLQAVGGVGASGRWTVGLPRWSENGWAPPRRSDLGRVPAVPGGTAVTSAQRDALVYRKWAEEARQPKPPDPIGYCRDCSGGRPWNCRRGCSERWRRHLEKELLSRGGR